MSIKKGDKVRVKNTNDRYEGIIGEVIKIDFTNFETPLGGETTNYPYRIRYMKDNEEEEKWAQPDQVELYHSICRECQGRELYNDSKQKYFCPFCKS